MAKIRISALAKEIDVQSKDVVSFLAAEGITVKAQNSIDDVVADKVRNNMKKETKAKVQEKTITSDAKVQENAVSPDIEVRKEKAVIPSDNQAKNHDNSDSEASKKKKSSISAVFNVQYSRNSHNDNSNNRNNRNNSNNSNNSINSGNSSSNNNNNKQNHKFSSDENRKNQNRQGARHQGQNNRNASTANTYRPMIKPRGGHGPIREDGTRVGEPTLEEQKKQEMKSRKAYSADSRTTEAHVSDAHTPGAHAQESHTKEVHNTEVRSNNNADAAKNVNKMHHSNNNDEKRRSDRPSQNNNTKPSSNNDRKDDRKFEKKDHAVDRNTGKFSKHQNNQGGQATPAQNVDKKESKPNQRLGKKAKKNNNRTGKPENTHFINLEKNGGKKKNKAPEQTKIVEEEVKSIKIPDHITVRDLADKMKIQPTTIIKDMFAKAVILTINTDLPYEKAENIALEYEILCEHEEKIDIIKEMLKEDDDAEDTLVERAPVVCVMGHVDHGKTSLLDAIRNTKVTDREAGGITQAIGAYVVNVNGHKITFLDTPGHEAFTAMRMRGASSTDIAILVVAADDGVMPQTVEAINHAKAAGVEVIVAVNKIDKPGANIERVKQELSEYELIPEDWGGSTTFVPVSAKTHEGIDELLEMILLTADVLELKANPKRKARGLVIESQLDRGKGVVATVLVQKGTLHVGDPISAGSSFGKVRAMIDDNGRRVKAAGPSTPVEIQGLNEVPNAGEMFVAQDSDKETRAFAQAFLNEEKNRLVEESRSRMSLDNLFSQVQSGNVKDLCIIVKADVQGSVQAVRQSLEKLSNEEVVVKIIHGGVGSINESDVVLASASNAIIIGFNVRPDAVAKDIAEREGVDIHLYNVIYNAIEDVERAMKGMLEPIYEEKVIGHGEVRQIFRSSKVGAIAGSFITDGTFNRGCKIRLMRDGNVIYDDNLSSLKRMKDDVKEVREGFECGVVLDGFNDIKEGDTMETYIMVEVPR